MRRGDQAIIYAFLTTHFETKRFPDGGKSPGNLEKKLKKPLGVQNSTRLAERI
jgi:hypothetical protein